MYGITCLRKKKEKEQKLLSRSAICVLTYGSIMSLTSSFSFYHSSDYGFQNLLNSIGKLEEEATMSVL